MAELTRRVLLKMTIAAAMMAVAAGLVWQAARPRLRFIGSRRPVYHRQTRGYTTDVYCFEGRFSDLAEGASAELYARGFRDDDRGMGSPEHDRIFVKGSARRTQVRLMAFAFDRATDDSIVWVPQPGWVSVEVRHVRPPLWTQLPVKWQIWYQLHVARRKTIAKGKPLTMPPGERTASHTLEGVHGRGGRIESPLVSRPVHRSTWSRDSSGILPVGACKAY